MNLALATLTIFVALIPGFSFFAAFHKGNISRKYTRTSIFSYVYEAIIPALILHLIFISYLNSDKNDWLPHVNIQFLGILFSGVSETVDFPVLFEKRVGNFLPYILSYLVLSGLIGWGVGAIIRFLIRAIEIDLRVPSIFRFDNEWFYAFNGEIFASNGLLGYSEYKKQYPNKGRITLIADVLCDVSGIPVIYNGIITNYFLDKDGIDTLYLKEVQRKKFRAKRIPKMITSKMSPKNSNVPETHLQQHDEEIKQDRKIDSLTNNGSFIIISNKNIYNIRVSIMPHEAELHKSLAESHKLIDEIMHESDATKASHNVKNTTPKK